MDSVTQDIRVKANLIRRNLVKGYSVNSTFYKLVVTISDEIILQRYVEHVAEAADRAEHNALLKKYVRRQAKPESRLDNLYRAAQAAQ